MQFMLLALVLAFQATPPPTPPPLVTPAPSPSASAPVTPVASPAPSPTLTPAALTASPAAVDLQPSQSQVITIGNATGVLTASVDVPIVSIAIDQTARTVTITATQQTGRATLSVFDSTGASIQIPVRVALPAAVVPASLTLRLTGNPIDPAWLQRQVQQAVIKALQLQPGVTAANVQVAAYTLPPTLGPGASAAVPITVQIAGGDQFLDVTAQVDVSLENLALDPFAPPLLLYDDDPEKIAQYGVLYRAQISPGAPARLYYYHQNTAEQRRLLVALTAAGASPATVQLIDASAGPNIDVMTVGHSVTRDFLSAKPRNQGVVLDVPAGAPVFADDFPAMKPLDGAAGSVGVRIVSGGPVTLTVLAVPVNAPAADIAAYMAGPQLPGDGHHRTGVFDISTFGQETIAYSSGGPDAQVQYGAATPPSADPASTGHDYGEYGVWRTLKFEVTNPGTTPATLYLYERPMGGVVRSSFLVDGTLVQVGCARVPNRYQIGQPFAANPGNSRLVVQTMTDGGSNYPLEVGLTATPPLPTTPPMSAPDGCFPKAQATPAPSPVASPQPPVPEPTG